MARVLFLRREEEEEEEEEEAAPSSNLLSAFAVQKTVEIPRLLFINIVVVFSCCGAKALSPLSGFTSCTCTRCSVPLLCRSSGSTGRDIPVVTPWLIPMVSFTMEIPQFFIDKVFVVPVVQVERVPVPSWMSQMA